MEVKLNGEKYIETIDEQIDTRINTRIARNKYIFSRNNAASQFLRLKYGRKLLGEFGEGRIPEWKTICKYQ